MQIVAKWARCILPRNILKRVCAFRSRIQKMLSNGKKKKKKEGVA